MQPTLSVKRGVGSLRIIMIALPRAVATKKDFAGFAGLNSCAVAADNLGLESPGIRNSPVNLGVAKTKLRAAMTSMRPRQRELSPNLGDGLGQAAAV